MLLGTASALWNNPFFIRLTPDSGFEIVPFATQAILLGIFVTIPVPSCGIKLARAGGVINYLGVACPVCNKLLMTIFGANLLLTYLEPMRVYLAGTGVVVTGLAIMVRLRQFNLKSVR